jgi:hypothetical protein
LPPHLVLQVGRWASAEQLSVADGVEVTELEDLISLPVAVTAARNYAVKVIETTREHADTFVEGDIAAKLKAQHGSLFDALKIAFTERLGSEFHIEKVGFVKEVVAALAISRGLGTVPPGIRDVERNIGLLIASIARLMRQANRQEQERRLNNRLERTVAGFLADHPSPTTREHGRLLIEEVEASIDDSEEGDRVKLLAEKLRREFELDINLTDPIDRFDEFRERVAALRYEERFVKQELKGFIAESPPSLPSDKAASPASQSPVIDESGSAR